MKFYYIFIAVILIITVFISLDGSVLSQTSPYNTKSFKQFMEDELSQKYPQTMLSAITIQEDPDSTAMEVLNIASIASNLLWLIPDGDILAVGVSILLGLISNSYSEPSTQVYINEIVSLINGTIDTFSFDSVLAQFDLVKQNMDQFTKGTTGSQIVNSTESNINTLINNVVQSLETIIGDSTNEFSSVMLLPLYVSACTMKIRLASHIRGNMDYYKQNEGDLISASIDGDLSVPSYYQYINDTVAIGLSNTDKTTKLQPGYTSKDIWNNRIKFMNYINDYVYDISNYWWSIMPGYSKGVLTINNRIAPSVMIGNSGKKVGLSTVLSTEDDIDALLASNNFYTYNGDLQGTTGFQQWNPVCNGDSSEPYGYTVMSYFPYLNGKDEINIMGNSSRIAISLNGTNFNTVYVSEYESLGVTNFGFSFDETFYFGQHFFSNFSTINSPNKKLAKIIPSSYELFMTENSGSYASYGCNPTNPYINGVIFGFINADSGAGNIIIESSVTQVDSIDYFYANPQVSYNPNLFRQYYGGLVFPPGQRISYEVFFNSYDGEPKPFEVYLMGNPSVNMTDLSLLVSQSVGNANACMAPLNTFKNTSAIVHYYELNRWKISDINLIPGVPNYVTIENLNSATININSLLFKDKKYGKQ